MKKGFFAIFFVLSTGFFSAQAEQNSPSPAFKTPTKEASQGVSALLRKPAICWVIPKKYWTNTRRAVWLGGLQGNVTVLEFFRIECPHCREAAPSRRALYLKYQNQGLKMIGFQSPAMGKEYDWKQVKSSIHDWQLPYPIAFDKGRKVFDKYKLTKFPSVFVLDKRGKVVFYQEGYTKNKAIDLEQAIVEALETDPNSPMKQIATKK